MVEHTYVTNEISKLVFMVCITCEATLLVRVGT